jgi:hypothetical protein
VVSGEWRVASGDDDDDDRWLVGLICVDIEPASDRAQDIQKQDAAACVMFVSTPKLSRHVVSLTHSTNHQFAD